MGKQIQKMCIVLNALQRFNLILNIVFLSLFNKIKYRVHQKLWESDPKILQARFKFVTTHINITTQHFSAHFNHQKHNTYHQMENDFYSNISTALPNHFLSAI